VIAFQSSAYAILFPLLPPALALPVAATGQGAEAGAQWQLDVKAGAQERCGGSLGDLGLKVVVEGVGPEHEALAGCGPRTDAKALGEALMGKRRDAALGRDADNVLGDAGKRFALRAAPSKRIR
jgi:hypothetical protein